MSHKFILFQGHLSLSWLLVINLIFLTTVKLVEASSLILIKQLWIAMMQVTTTSSNWMVASTTSLRVEMCLPALQFN